MPLMVCGISTQHTCPPSVQIEFPFGDMFLVLTKYQNRVNSSTRGARRGDRLRVTSCVPRSNETVACSVLAPT